MATARFEARIVDCVTLSYRTPAASVRPLLPDGLELVTRGRWAFWSIAIHRFEQARPAGVPAWCGVGGVLVSYRLLAQAMNDGGELHRGQAVVRSDADAAFVAALGDRVTQPPPGPADITFEEDAERITCRVVGTLRGGGEAVIRMTSDAPVRAGDSCFPTLLDAVQRFDGPASTLAVEQAEGARWLRRTVLSHDRQAWRQTPVSVAEARFSFLDALGQDEAALELATRVEPVDANWVAMPREGLISGRLQHQAHARRSRAVAAIAAA